MIQVRIKRVYEDFSETDGYRVLVDKLWPRGMKKEWLKYDYWAKDITTFNEEYFKNAVSIALLFRESDKIVRKQSWYRSYKANIVEYALAKIFYTVNTQYPNSAINLKNIWQKQILSAEWVKQIEDASFAMYQYLIRKDRGVENVTEWAKREACWKGAKELPYTLLPEFAKELQSREIAAS